MTFILIIVKTAAVTTDPDVGICAGARMVANGAGVRGVAGLNATVWIENKAGEVCNGGKVCINDCDAGSNVSFNVETGRTSVVLRVTDQKVAIYN